MQQSTFYHIITYFLAIYSKLSMSGYYYQNMQTSDIIVGSYVDPFEPPMPPKIGPEFTKNIAESFAKEQSYVDRMTLTSSRNQINVPSKDAVKTNITNGKKFYIKKRIKCQFYKYILN